MVHMPRRGVRAAAPALARRTSAVEEPHGMVHMRPACPVGQTTHRAAIVVLVILYFTPPEGHPT